VQKRFLVSICYTLNPIIHGIGRLYQNKMIARHYFLGVNPYWQRICYSGKIGATKMIADAIIFVAVQENNTAKNIFKNPWHTATAML
jgi:hypothetical protein